ncbi:malate synthase A [Agrococcus sp. SCSIO52902]|uniref:malate synthase A n=1 Tax=Agrococcus sp. SCSIO52902 TaxID=2933290 RepID=UPI001FF254D5|nr:malate synthase A [Agrococcus sp. SCSIO52902]UOW00802.1 malate synthase A [Agrococcus sp. SCSIO52902]UOW00864.1 malate synthase A [Agrococcus sp. SCSIO52902]
MDTTRIRITAHAPGQDRVLTDEALGFLLQLHDAFECTRQQLLQDRRRRRAAFADGDSPRFLESTRRIREDASWRVAPPAPGLEDRRVEITGPIERKMTINALNSGAKVWLADCEDASSPLWRNVIASQVNLQDAIRGSIAFTSPEGKEYKVTAPETPTIVVRPRGWHLDEHRILVDGRPMSGSLVDFGLHVLHNADDLIAAGRGPYFYLPKLESHHEARLWNDVFVMAQQLLVLPQGTIRATVLIETITAAFEMEEILFELREHSAGLNAGRWDYLFSMIKAFRLRGPEFVLPDRARLTMTAPFMRAYTEQLVRACHRRGAHAIGGMAAFVPSAKDPDATERALAAVASDKAREAGDGFDGSWVAHPGLVETCRSAFDAVLGDRPNQLERTREEVPVDGAALIDLSTTEGDITEAGLRSNIEIGIRYMEAWLRGHGAVAIHSLMEDAATAEISRSQVWQWIHNESATADGRTITRERCEAIVDELAAGFDRSPGNRYREAIALFREIALEETYPAFLTLAGTERYLGDGAERPITGPIPVQERVAA